ncbi:signal transduction histidine kinase regulating citrate/malate metabolism [Desulfofarcimen acetoxidans DSM 771]|uniref:Signal transduction histidine kinase regulating citrate/malate metabolism n=1 Tax=Desulfofarcimen acetoxidans (strain ATCC 49208 / DSM 771 / KCTC 5769 / VKM B-1644 / 5575) TaxID=485916 RepID=C8W1R9_DESAS|nr:signal transduction histidine kinase regulating citrate/malate metabolism [Desulfofarcimen acetoxidans DSM 771]
MIVLFKNVRLLIISTILMETLLIVLMNQQIFLSKDINDLKMFLPFLNLVDLILSGLVIFSIKGLEENTKKVMEFNLLKSHLLQVEELLNILQTQKHEHSRHIQTIQAMLYLEEVDKAIEYIEGIAESYRYTEEIVYVGHPAITALLNSKRKVAETKKIDFAFSVKCDIANMDVHPWDLCSILGNLLDNALEAALQDHVDHRASLEIKHEDDNYVLYVHNTGPKISKSVKQQLFTAAYTTKESEASGYGLYLVKKLVDRYRGKIDVISGEGTTFIVYLPDRGRGIDDKSICSENCCNHGSSITG